MRQKKRITPLTSLGTAAGPGIDVAYLQQRLWHASLSTTAIYLKARPNYSDERAGFDEMLKPKR